MRKLLLQIFIIFYCFAVNAQQGRECVEEAQHCDSTKGIYCCNTEMFECKEGLCKTKCADLHEECVKNGVPDCCNQTEHDCKDYIDPNKKLVNVCVIPCLDRPNYRADCVSPSDCCGTLTCKNNKCCSKLECEINDDCCGSDNNIVCLKDSHKCDECIEEGKKCTDSSECCFGQCNEGVCGCIKPNMDCEKSSQCCPAENENSVCAPEDLLNNDSNKVCKPASKAYCIEPNKACTEQNCCEDEEKKYTCEGSSDQKKCIGRKKQGVACNPEDNDCVEGAKCENGKCTVCKKCSNDNDCRSLVDDVNKAKCRDIVDGSGCCQTAWVCGDKVCDPLTTEDHFNCPQDCPGKCGDNCCELDDLQNGCTQDCPQKVFPPPQGCVFVQPEDPCTSVCSQPNRCGNIQIGGKNCNCNPCFEIGFTCNTQGYCVNSNAECFNKCTGRCGNYNGCDCGNCRSDEECDQFTNTCKFKPKSGNGDICDQVSTSICPCGLQCKSSFTGNRYCLDDGKGGCFGLLLD